MKEIIAVIRPEKWRDTQRAALAAGASGITQHRALGRGKQAGLRYEGGSGSVVMGYLPKRLVSCVTEDAQADRVLEAIMQANRTGNPGDGKIFVCPVEDTWRVRTGEHGGKALS